MNGGIDRIEQVVITASAAAAICDESVRSADGHETGGVLLGHIGTNAWVRHAGGPGPAAVHRPNFFLRDLHHAQRLAAEAFAHDQSVWIGEWHTHPRAGPIPSTRDLNTYLSLLADPQLRFEAFIALIVVAPDDTWCRPEAHAWICYDHAVEPAPLTIAPTP
jgi:integrative and conjugative element protein (TIGR02256 family)